MYSRERPHKCIRNIIYFFSFPFIIQNVWMGWVWESLRWLSCTHRGWDTNLQWTPFFLLFVLKSSRWNNIPDSHENSHGHISSILPSTWCTWSFFLLACHTCSVCFRYQVYFLLFLFNQSLTSAAASTDVKEVFKSISNTNIILIVITILKLHCRHRFLWFSQSMYPHHSLLFEGLPDYILCQYIADVPTPPLGQDMTHQFLSGV